MEIFRNEIRSPLHIVRCVGELLLMRIIEDVRAFDDAIVELPDE